ncbi:peroxidasin-like isoform X2 [Liolophura sinensis]|uniref:peroxidasin-like isoform X2 n=1 Tax=Liolophura sinensis TaxID=3198878 RepID=UPI0031597E68
MAGSRVFLVLSLWMVFTKAERCPHPCVCYSTTVRCMYAQLERIPTVPASTTVLDLRYNRIRDIPQGAFNNLNNLHTLLLNDNEITEIRAGAFIGLPELRSLYLYKNEISNIEGRSFAGLEKLEKLFLQNNQLKRLPPGVFAYSNNLRRLRLDSNALICDCQIMWLAEKLKSDQTHTQAAATCQQPRELQGRSLTSIANDEFQCSRPRFTMEPRDVDVTFGNTAYFTCRAEGDPSPEITWLHNNNEIDTNDSRYRVLDDGTLMIHRTIENDKGVYECVAKNVAGEAKTSGVELRYFGDPVPPNFIRTPKDVTTVVGQTIQLECSAEGHPKPEITWTLNNNALPLDRRFTVLSSGALLISDIHPDDHGEYRCTAVNSIDRIVTDVNVAVQIPPLFRTNPPLEVAVSLGDVAEFRCVADGSPGVIHSWSKEGISLGNRGRYEVLDDGKTLRILNTQVSDGGTYNCVAENSAGRIEVSVELKIANQLPPTFTRQLSDVDALVSSNVDLDCAATGDPQPQVRWLRDGVPIRDSRRFQLSNHILQIRGVTKAEEGIYECVATNGAGAARSSIRLWVRNSNTSYPGDAFVRNSLQEAINSVDNAVNNTLTHLRDRSRTHSVQDLLQLVRYPSPTALSLARAAEVFEQTLELIHNHVRNGHNYNTHGHELSYGELVSPSHIHLIANMSGCLRQQPDIDCSDMCFHQKYRMADGTCNNLQHPTWGASNMAFKRLKKPVYENGFNTPIGWDRNKLYNGHRLPSARLVSTTMMSSRHVTSDESSTHMLMQWGQFLDHDLTLSPQSISYARFSDGRRCNDTCDNRYPCFPIPVPGDDPRIRTHTCIGVSRSSATCRSGTTSLFFNTLAPREQINALTSYIDASNVYGNTIGDAERLRDYEEDKGLLRVGPRGIAGKPLLPFDTNGIIAQADCQIENGKRHVPCFLAGDHRANEQLALTAMHTLWLRQHNTMATELKEINSHWDNNVLYHETKKIIGAMMQHITYSHWLPEVLGPIGMEKLGPYEGYNPSVDPTITNEFATAAFRFGHSLIQPVMFRLNSSFQQISEGNLPLHRAFFSPYRLMEEGGIDPLLRGMFGVASKKRMPAEMMNKELTEKLFALANHVGKDLAALNIQRGRDHGIPGYNVYREMCNMTKVTNFNELRGEIPDWNVRSKLRSLYGHPDNVDLFVGLMSENPLPGSKLGPTLMCMLVDQFKKLRSGDRFWYENPGVFSPAQLVQIKHSSLSSVICQSSDSIEEIQSDVFHMAHHPQDYLSCSRIPKLDLKLWADCCEDCNSAGQFNTITGLFRGRRSPQHSYPNDFPQGQTGFQQVNIPQAGHTHNIAASHNNHIDSSSTLGTTFKTEMEEFTRRMHGMEGMMHKMTKDIKKLKRKVRRIEKGMEHSGGGCMDEQERPRKNDEKWKVHDCKTCICQKGQVQCDTMLCPIPTCHEPRKIPDQCCPEC